MRLKSLEMVGFKSFAERVTVDLAGDVTCFVGPNGCGKSNIVDAVKWVLGEQRVSALRGDRMHDVIFKGNASGRRGPMNFAEVSLTISNDCGSLPVEFEEVVVTRRLFRSGESEYLLNRSPVRLKDIKKLFMNTGVGLDAYSIMEQGKIDGILEANPRDRRAIFEEAAGISLFKAQRREAERKLERTCANLLRLGDIIDELEKRIRSLKNQAGRARSYLRLSERITALRRKYYRGIYASLGERLAGLRESAAAASREEAEQRRELSRRQEEREELDGGLNALKDVLFDKRARLGELKTALEECDGKISMLEKRLVEIKGELAETWKRDEELKERRSRREEEYSGVVGSLQALAAEERSLEEDEKENRRLMQAAGDKLEECLERIEELENDIVDLSRKEVEIGNKMVEARARLKGLHAARGRIVHKQHAIADELHACRTEGAVLEKGLVRRQSVLRDLSSNLETGRSRAGALESGLNGLNDEIKGVESELVKGESRIDFLDNLVRRRDGMADGVRAVMDEAARPDGDLGFVMGVLGEMLDVDVKDSKALESVLGDLAEAVVVRDIGESARVLGFLREKDLSGVIILALSEFGIPERDVDRPDSSLADRIVFRDELKALVEERLAGIRILDGQDTPAGNLGRDGSHSNLSAQSGPWVNLRGDFYSRGVLRVGGASREPGVIARRSELSALVTEMEGVGIRMEALKERKGVLEKELAAVRGSNESIAAELDGQEFEIAAQSAEHGKIVDRMNRLFRELKVLLEEGYDIEKSITSLNGELKELEMERDGIRGGVGRRSKSLDVANIEVAGHRSESQRLDQLLKELEIKIVTHRGRRESLEREKDYLEKNLEESRNRLEELERDRERLESLSGDVRREIEQLKKRTEEMASERVELSSGVDDLNGRLEGLRAEFEGKNRAVAAAEELVEACREKLDGFRMEIREVEVKQQNLRERARDEINVDLDIDEPEAAGAEEEPASEEAEGVSESSGAISAEKEIDPAAMEREIQELRGRIARIGNVNLEAVTELETVQERFNHLTEQRDDLLKAQKSLQEMITELNKVSRQRFVETFEDVRSHFNGVFRKLFHGGRADIQLREDEDVLEAGIDIIAGPPRKDVRSISLLSGGERTLTAVALLFALFKARPSPFCLLDEVDAALDETNIERFCSLLVDFIENSQFMIVTHSKRTMSHADILYGVTMEEGGVSKLISMKLAEYQERVA